MPQIFVRKFVRNAGSIDLNVDASGGPIVFEMNFNEDRMDLRYFDISINAGGRLVRIDRFLTLDDPLLNGIQIEAQTQGEPFIPEPIFNTEDLIAISDKTSKIETITENTAINFRGRVSIPQQGIVLSSNRGDFLRVTLNDDFSELNYFTIAAWGVVQ